MRSSTRGDSISVVRIEPDDDRFADLQRLRYQVYCLERRLIQPDLFCDDREADAYDDVAIHFGVFLDDRLAGSVRLVPDSVIGFPMERFAGRLGDAAGLPRDRTGEISRLVFAPHYRGRVNTTTAGLLFALLSAAYQESLTLGIDGLIAALEPDLLRLCERLGFVLHRIGPTVDYFGPVLPCAVTGLPVDFARPRRSIRELARPIRELALA